jgi:hypothetical protein
MDNVRAAPVDLTMTLSIRFAYFVQQVPPSIQTPTNVHLTGMALQFVQQVLLSTPLNNDVYVPFKLHMIMELYALHALSLIIGMLPIRCVVNAPMDMSITKLCSNFNPVNLTPQ